MIKKFIFVLSLTSLSFSCSQPVREYEIIDNGKHITLKLYSDSTYVEEIQENENIIKYSGNWEGDFAEDSIFTTNATMSGFNVLTTTPIVSYKIKNGKAVLNNLIKEEIDSSNNYPDSYYFKDGLKDWFNLRSSLINNVYPITLIEKNNKDTIKNIFLEFDFGNYYFTSFKSSTKTVIPLFHIENSSDKISPKLIYNHYKRIYSDQVSFYGKIGSPNHEIEFSFSLIDKENKTYRIVQKEVYQPNFETAPVVNGRRIFIISLKEGTINYELEGNFKDNWY